MRSFVLRAALLLLAFVPPGAGAQPLKPWSGGATPALELAGLDGAKHSLRDYRGRVVLVNFWATWCPPCLEEMPSIEKLRRSLDARRFAVLAVNVGEGPRVAGEFAAKMGLGGFTVLLDRELKASRSWGARVLPATFVVGPDGVVRYSYTGAIDWSRADVREAIAALMTR